MYSKKSAVKVDRGLSSRLRFIEASSELMIENRSIDVPISSIAARAGLNSALIKYHFGNKNGLLAAVALKASEHNMEALATITETIMPARRKMEIHLSGLINLYWRYPYINSLIQYLVDTGEDKYKDLMETKILQPFTTLQIRIIEQGLASGEFKKVDPELTFYILRGACSSLIDAARAMNNAYRVRSLSKEERLRYTRAVVEILLTGLCS